ncbi:hypothetical protein N7532_003553 [Penicillium argentinense]|uniref:Uncharacterized protein n=1 Tax=Penicillium argentinense TaxID=1131581 RepID=A0A9W9FMR4_9EURO|nr:uncharacterized protein N7532_003553 [Penicillium argentinense]KAJ5103024.1 hypothetical protein N7532_003553 [Penicillium argentinense]
MSSSMLWIWAPDGQWEAATFGFEPYNFPFASYDQVQNFANLMASGDIDSLISSLPTIFTTDVDPQTIYSVLLQQQSQITWLGDFFFPEEPEDALCFELEEVGEFLLGFLAGAMTYQKKSKYVKAPPAALAQTKPPAKVPEAT